MKTSASLHLLFILYGILLIWLYPRDIVLVTIGLAIIIQHASIYKSDTDTGPIPRWLVILGAGIGIVRGIQVQSWIVILPMAYSFLSKFGIIQIEKCI